MILWNGNVFAKKVAACHVCIISPGGRRNQIYSFMLKCTAIELNIFHGVNEYGEQKED
jgi:hypothetical protein